MRLVDDDKFKTLASAGNDLKKLKALIPEGFDITKLNETLSELDALKGVNKSEIEKLTATVDKLVSKDAQQKEDNKTLKEKNRQLIIDNKVGEGLSIGAAEGTYVDTVFVDRDALYKLDPEDATFEDKVKEILKSALKEQQDFLMKVGAVGNQRVGEGIGQRGEQQMDYNKQAASILNKKRDWPWMGVKKE